MNRKETWALCRGREALSEPEARGPGGGRIWYLVDETNRTVWVTFAGTGQPKATD